MLKAKGGHKLLSEKLYKLRKNRGLSQEQLAEQLNVSRQAISKWEQGTAVPESEKLIAISNCCRCKFTPERQKEIGGNLYEED